MIEFKKHGGAGWGLDKAYLARVCVVYLNFKHCLVFWGQKGWLVGVTKASICWYLTQ